MLERQIGTNDRQMAQIAFAAWDKGVGDVEDFGSWTQMWVEFRKMFETRMMPRTGVGQGWREEKILRECCVG